MLRYTQEWERYVTRQARWVDFANDYKTMDLSYMESVMWALKQLWDKGLLYEDYRVLPYCWECETPLSNSETRQDDAYRDRQDPAVTVAFDPRPPAPAGAGAWSPGRCSALGVDDDAVDAAVQPGPGRRARTSTTPCSSADGAPRRARRGDRWPATSQQLEGAEPIGTVTGADLVGRRYRPLFPTSPTTPNAFVVLAGDFVTTDEGTGVVHMAPGFGEDDQIACAAAGIPVVCPVDDRTRFTAEVPDFEGLQVFEANQPVIRALREQGALVRSDSLRPRLPALLADRHPAGLPGRDVVVRQGDRHQGPPARLNQEINWVPEHVRDGSFGKWLANARDWSISRNRFWGSPIPVWKSDDPAYPRIDVYGSLDELERDFGVRPDRPAPPGHRRADPAQPRRPDRALDHAPGHRRARLLVRVRLDAVRPGALPVREPGVVRRPLPRRLHRRVHRPDPGLVLHPARAGRRPVRPARPSRPAWPTASCSATTARRCPSGCATTPTPRPCSPPTAPTPCAGS